MENTCKKTNILGTLKLTTAHDTAMTTLCQSIVFAYFLG